MFRLFNLVHLKLSYSLDLWRCSRSYHFSIFSALDFSSCTCWPYVLISLFSLQLSHNLVSKYLSLVTCIFLSLWVLIKFFYVDVDISILDIFRYFIVDHFHVFFEDFFSYQPYLILSNFLFFRIDSYRIQKCPTFSFSSFWEFSFSFISSFKTNRRLIRFTLQG